MSAINACRFSFTPLNMAAIAAVVAMMGAGGFVIAQQAGDSAPLEINQDGGASFEVSGIDVDISARTAEAARTAGFREAQRRGWKMLFARMTGQPISTAPGLTDSALDGLVSGIVIEKEQVGPTRYIARLGVMFDRARAGQLLGVKGQVMRSPPMLTIPVLIDGGAAQTIEDRTPWARAWARFRAGASPVDYIRPTGAGADSQLLSYAQTKRPDRLWWLGILDQYGASDVLVAEAQIDRDYPGGPVIGRFTARHGPDGLVIAQFALRTGASAGLDAMLDEAVRRMDAAYGQALRDGRLKPDPSLRFEGVPDVALSIPVTPESAIMGTSSVEVQVVAPDATALSAVESSIRSASGVTGTMISSLSIGGISRIQISYVGDFATLRWALDQRGYRLDDSGEGYRLRRRREDEAPLPPPAPPPPPSVAVPGAPQNLLPPG